MTASAELALWLWIAYAILTLGVRVALQLRATGRTGLVLAGTRPGSTQWWGETLQLLAMGLAVAAPIASSGVEPIAALDGDGGHVAGVALFALGTLLIVVAQSTMGASWRIGQDPDERTELVTHGPFAHMRNPIFSGLVAVQAGIVLLVPSVLALAGLALLAISIEIQVRLVEEPHLRAVHGEPYAAYAARTGRFLPGVGVVNRRRSRR